MLISGIYSRARRVRRNGRIFIADAMLAARYGRSAPRKFMLIHTVPGEISRVAEKSRFEKPRKGQPEVVIGGEWDVASFPWEESSRNEGHLILSATRKRVSDGSSWSETGVYERLERLIERNGGSFDGCRSPSDVVERYRRIDDIITFALDYGELKPFGKMHGGFRELGGIDVSVGRDGEILKSGGGSHRLAVAKAVGIPCVPVCVNAVHPQAMISGAWERVLNRSQCLVRGQNCGAHHDR